jgi:hypothetical protein
MGLSQIPGPTCPAMNSHSFQGDIWRRSSAASGSLGSPYGAEASSALNAAEATPRILSLSTPEDP